VGTAVYRLAGLRIASDFPLAGLESCSSDAAAHNDVVIRRTPLPASLALDAMAHPEHSQMQQIEGHHGQEVFLHIPRVAQFLVRAGREILIDPAPSSDTGEVRAYLLGTVFGVLCHQRGITPLHASAVDLKDGCVAFVGASGAGKSTLVAAMARRGHEIICDDVCFLQLDGKGNVLVGPGIERIRLWEDAMYALGYDGPGVEQEMHGYNKYFIPIRSPRNRAHRRRLRGVYELHPSPDDAIEVSPLQGSVAVEVLMQNVYRLNLAERLGYKPPAFIACAQAARNVPIFRLSRPKHFRALAGTIGVLEDHLHQMR